MAIIKRDIHGVTTQTIMMEMPTPKTPIKYIFIIPERIRHGKPGSRVLTTE